jgi:beta-N-acetylhexosaminidase
VATGVDAVMTAHIVVASEDQAPASLSARWTQHLRERGFHGAIITDALDMDAVAEGRGIEGVADAAVRALRAGADLLCLGSNFDAAMTDTVTDVVVQALDEGVLDREALERSRSRNVALRRAAVDASEHTTDAAALVAAQAIIVQGEIPPGPFAVLECRPRLTAVCFNVRWGVADLLAERGWTTASIRHDDDLEAVCDAFVDAAGERPVLVVVRDAGLQPWQAQVVDRCIGRGAGDVVVAEMGWPDGRALEAVVEHGRPPAATIVTYGASRASALALVDRLVMKES